MPPRKKKRTSEDSKAEQGSAPVRRSGRVKGSPKKLALDTRASGNVEVNKTADAKSEIINVKDKDFIEHCGQIYTMLVDGEMRIYLGHDVAADLLFSDCSCSTPLKHEDIESAIDYVSKYASKESKLSGDTVSMNDKAMMASSKENSLALIPRSTSTSVSSVSSSPMAAGLDATGLFDNGGVSFGTMQGSTLSSGATTASSSRLFNNGGSSLATIQTPSSPSANNNVSTIVGATNNVTATSSSNNVDTTFTTVQASSLPGATSTVATTEPSIVASSGGITFDTMQAPSVSNAISSSLIAADQAASSVSTNDDSNLSALRSHLRSNTNAGFYRFSVSPIIEDHKGIKRVSISFQFLRSRHSEYWCYKPKFLKEALTALKVLQSSQYMSAFEDIMCYQKRDIPYGCNKGRTTNDKYGNSYPVEAVNIVLILSGVVQTPEEELTFFIHNLKNIMSSSMFKTLYTEVLAAQASENFCKKIDSDFWLSLERGALDITQNEALDAIFLDAAIMQIMRKLFPGIPIGNWNDGIRKIAYKDGTIPTLVV